MFCDFSQVIVLAEQRPPFPILDEQTGEVHVMQMDVCEFAGSELNKLLDSGFSH